MFESLKKKFSEIISKKSEEEPEENKKKKKDTSKKSTKKSSAKKPSEKQEKKSKKNSEEETPEKEKNSKKSNKKNSPPKITQEEIMKEYLEEKSPEKSLSPKKTSEETPEPQKSEEETPKEELKEELSEPSDPKEKSGFFSKLKTKISNSKLTEEQFEELFYEFEITLLENNVALEAVDKIKESLSQKLTNIEIKKSEVESKILNALKETISDLLIEPPNLIEKIKEKQGVFTILFFGINGSGKTTSIAKLASKLESQNISTVLAAGDTFRAASIEQLKTHGSTLKVPVIAHEYNSDPASVAFDAIKYAKSNNKKVVLIDTAGRMYTASNLMREMEKIIRVTKPDLKIFVGESISGNDATSQARTFNESVGIDGIILSKADIDEKSGTILSVSEVTGKPIYFLGTGQNYKNLENFKKENVLKNLGLEIE